MLNFCDEVVVLDGGSTDGTWEALQALAETIPNGKLVIKQNVRNWSHPRFAVFDGDQKAEARKICQAEYCWQQDADEIVHEDDYANIISIIRNFPTGVDLVSLPVIEYWGSDQKIRIDVNPWKWRLSKNLPHITHGIPKELRTFDNEDNLHALPGTDGCDYVNSETFERINHATFYNEEIHRARMAALNGDIPALQNYQGWFNALISQLPGVHHYSWFDMNRKIKTYKNYWQSHWESLYDVKQDDTAENNMFFQRPWSEVTDEEIEVMASELSEKMGGWVFHSPVDFSKPTPHLSIERKQPAIMLEEK
jgi:glycosyltransferase involved in cell wall biosynthesis